MNQQAPFIVAGIVKDKQTGEPIIDAHVFTIKGEEEAVTNGRGEFRFETWKRTEVLETQKKGY